MSEDLKLKNINELLSDQYYVPAYQRGYRWTDDQVNALLNDVWEFRENPPKQEEGEEKPFYCLQPVVVKEKQFQGESYWEVIDGQQRLTTIFIILNYFNITEYSNRPKKLFSLTYQTRNNCSAFFNDIENAGLAKQNIDFFHINEAHKTIDQWFSIKEKDNDSIRHDFRSTLVNDVKIIWYEAKVEDTTNEESASIDIFTRLNIGKIPLTNAELVKALFLQRVNFQEDKASLKQLQIASEWDMIEKTLQNNSFWYFIYNPKNPLHYDNRIEYIFDLMKEKKKDHENLFTFFKFHEDFVKSKNENGAPDINTLWLEIKRYFLRIEEWYNNKELYHLIGFLVDCGVNIDTLKKESQNRTKISFKTYLKDEISKRVKFQIDKLSYGNDEIKKILLLFNIQTILATENADMRFPFFRYKIEEWDIEHIRSQTDKKIAGKNRKEWILDVLEYFTGERAYSTFEELEKQKKAISQLNGAEKSFAEQLLDLGYADEIDEDIFNNLYQKISSHFHEDNDFEDKDGIGNLALLDARTNRSYGNAMFPIKRRIINKNDMSGVFVPICTKNVFMKSYSRKMGEVMYWTNNDANDYRNSIKDVLKEYIPIQEEQDE